MRLNSRFCAILTLCSALQLFSCRTSENESKTTEVNDPNIDRNQAQNITKAVSNATESLEYALNMKDSGSHPVISDKLAKDTLCVAALRLERGALLLGGGGGDGLMSCRTPSGAWSAPSFLIVAGFDLSAAIGFERSAVTILITKPAIAQNWKNNGTFEVDTYAKAVAADAQAALAAAETYGMTVIQVANGGLYAGVGVSLRKLSHMDDTRNLAVYADAIGSGLPKEKDGRSCSTYVIARRRNACITDWENRTKKKFVPISGKNILDTPADKAPVLTKTFNDAIRKSRLK